jgi:glutathione S-transferase
VDLLQLVKSIYQSSSQKRDDFPQCEIIAKICTSQGFGLRQARLPTTMAGIHCCKREPPMSLILHVFGPAFGLPDPSPFAMKGDMLMKLSGLDYRPRPGDVTKAPKKKFPVLVDSGEFIPDSTFIRLHLEQKYGIDFDKGLSARERGIAYAVEKMLEDNLYWAIMYERWNVDENFDRGPRSFFDAIPQPIRTIAVPLIRRQVKRNLWGHGMGRHSRAEICRLGAMALQSLADVLGGNRYLIGDAPCGADATAFAFAASALCPVFESELLACAQCHANLVAYNERMMKQFYPELVGAG